MSTRTSRTRRNVNIGEMAAKTMTSFSGLTSEQNDNFPFLIHDNTQDTFLYSSCNNSVAVEQNRTRLGTCTYPDDIMDVIVFSTKAGSSWLSLTTVGDVWKTGSQDVSTPAAEIDHESMDTGPDIFSELMDDSETTSSAKAPQMIGQVTSNNSCGRKIIQGIRNAKRLVLFGESLIVLVHNELGWALLHYSLTDLTSSKSGFNKPSRIIHLDNLSSTSNSSKEETNVSSYMDDSLMKNDPELFILAPSSCQFSGISMTIKKTLIVSDEMFTYLCGPELALIRTPVILVTAPGGLIFLFGLRSLPGIRESVNIMMDVRETAVAMFTLSTSVSIRQGESCLKIYHPSQEQPNNANCLVIVGQHGKITILIYLKQDSKRQKSEKSCPVVKQEFYVPGPVACVDLHKNILVHSTTKETFTTDLSLIFSSLLDHQEVVPVTRNSGTEMLASQPMGVCNVIAISVKAPKSTTADVVTEIPFLAWTSRKRLMYLNASMKHTEKAVKSPKPSGSVIKDLLIGITRVSELTTTTQQRLKMLDNILHQVNIASLIASCAIRIRDKSFKNSILVAEDCPVNVTWRVESKEISSGEISFTLVVRIETKMKVNLGDGWWCTLALVPGTENAEFLSEDLSGSLNQIPTKSSSLDEMNPGQFHEIHWALGEYVHNPRSLPLLLITKLIYNVPKYQFSDSQNSASSESDRCLCIPLPVVRLDVIHFLCAANISQKPSGQLKLNQNSSQTEILKRMAETRTCYPSYGFSEKNEKSHLHGSHSSSILISSEQILAIGVGDGHAPKDEVLPWLFKENSLLSATAGASSSISLVTPDSHHVSLRVHTIEENSGLEVLVHSDNLLLSCQVEQAITTRLQNLQCVETATAPTVTQARKALLKIQALHKEAESLQDSLTENLSESSASLQQILQLYQRIKDVKI